MGSVIVYTLLKACTKVVSNSVGHFMWNGSNFLTNCIFKLFNRLLYTFDLRYPQRKNRTDLNQVCQMILTDPIYIYIYIYSVCVCVCVCVLGKLQPLWEINFARGLYFLQVLFTVLQIIICWVLSLKVVCNCSTTAQFTTTEILKRHAVQLTFTPDASWGSWRT